MRVAALNADVIVFVSDVWQTTCTAVRAGDEGFLIDSPVYPDELEALPACCEQAGFPVSGLLATHGDWDHLLGRLAFPEASLGLRGDRRRRRLAAEPGAAQRRLREFDDEHYVERDRPLALGHDAVAARARPPRARARPRARAASPRRATRATASAYWLPWLRVLVCGDYLSPVEIPMLSSGGSLEAYRETLRRLDELTERAGWVVPGHGAPLQSGQARELLAEDEAYLEQLAQDPAAAKPPRSRSSPTQTQIHQANVTACSADG